MTTSRALFVFIAFGIASPSASATPLVVLDPGHGGSNTGATGRRAPGAVLPTLEKQLTLTFARLIAQRLVQRGIASELTRTRDRYLTLHDRSRVANGGETVCFVSVHANASPDHSRRGIETYVYDREATDVAAYRATTQAANDVVAGRLAALEIVNTLHDSLRLGRLLQSHLAQTGLSPNRGVRQASFDVLAGVNAPAVLVEIGFIDHPVEGPMLLDPTVQRQLANAVGDGIAEFVTARVPTAKVSMSKSTSLFARTP